MATEKQTLTSYDVIIIGAGISGINAAYRMQTESPGLTYTILEGRETLGGTWSLFKYPGIRSDSDLHTFGFSWEPWTRTNPIAEAGAILDYLNSTVKKHHIDEKIQYKHFVNKLNWSSVDKRWHIDVENNGSKQEYSAQFVIMGTGYYDYNHPLEAKIPGLDNFKGKIVHPQFWPEDLDYTNKNVAIIGSGATAITLLPNLAKKAKHVTQVQRSPSYYLALPQDSPLDRFANNYLPTFLAKKVIRLKYLLGGLVLYNFCRMFPNAATRFLQKGVAAEMPADFAINPHFQPRYKPWDQRLCLTPSGDYFEAYRNGKASIKTDTIDTVTANSIVLKSGEEIPADIIITATGLKIQVGGGAQMTLDDRPIQIADKFLWKGAMLKDVPNLFYVIGYANASWTLAADSTALLATRMMNSLKSRGLKSATPTATPAETKQMDEDNVPPLPLNSTYVTNAMNRRVMPRAGKSGNWKPKSNHFRDMYQARYGNISDGLIVQ